ncbi:GNAT family N-acetyltransferase [Acinetobacter ihumii]|uniref:GNAT family N-acetyltransferase n=1 Tax=Acinetobacter ihumii TaxID=2483802 RepID=UPI00102F5CC7|nr:GNAT family N-acetyltransferase [Acinetobacter ihumii]
MLTINKILNLPHDFNILVECSVHERFRFLKRLKEEFETEKNQYLKVGEALFEARWNQELIAICGLNCDPFVKGDISVQKNQIGRLRRFYVHPDYRKQGIGRTLLETVETHAMDYFKVLHLYTDTEDAAQFYLKMGYAFFVDEQSNYRKNLLNFKQFA